MKTCRVLSLALAASCLLTGCSALLERSYSSVQPHTSQYWEEGAFSSVLRVEDYQSLVNGLLVLVANQTETGVVRLYGYTDQSVVVADMDRACAEVTMEDPLGAYLVEYVTYECTEGTSCYEVTVKLSYRKTPAQLREMVNATAAGALPDLLRTALDEGRTELTVKVGYMDQSAGDLYDSLAAVMAEAGWSEENWSVQYYPEAWEVGDARVVEIVWQTPEALDAFRENMPQQVPAKAEDP